MHEVWLHDGGSAEETGTIPRKRKKKSMGEIESPAER
jgi:hypothetical protein